MSIFHPPKILMIHAGGIGDLLLALPALRAFRMAFPDSSPELLGLPERLSVIAHDLGAVSIHSIHQADMAHFYLKGGVLPSRLVGFFSSFSAALLIGTLPGRDPGGKPPPGRSPPGDFSSFLSRRWGKIARFRRSPQGAPALRDSGERGFFPSSPFRRSSFVRR